MVEAALVLCVISEELVTAMLFTITLVEATGAGSGGATTEHEDFITSTVVVGPVDTGNRVQDVSPSPTLQEGPQEELMSVRSVMAKETCAVKRKKKCTLSELATKSTTWPQSRTGEPEAGKRGFMNY